MIEVFDIGARYGVHPSWQRLFNFNLIQYTAFEPEQEGFREIRNQYAHYPNYHAVNAALGSTSQIVQLNVLKHKGLSTLLKPNVDSIWFKQEGREQESNMLEIQEVQSWSTVDYCKQFNVHPNFLKIDTEGYEMNVLHGAKELLPEIMGLRIEVPFSQTFEGGGNAQEIIGCLLDQGFVLANIDYDGKGIAQSYFCPNPQRFGLMASSDAVFITKDFLGDCKADLLCIFLFENNLEDLAFLILQNNRKLVGLWDSKIRHFLELRFLECVHKLSFLPYSRVSQAHLDYEQNFNKVFPKRDKFWGYRNTLIAKLST